MINFEIHEIPGSFEDCARVAAEVARDTQRESMPVRVFRQGPRRMVSGVLPVRVLARVLGTRSAVKGAGSLVGNALNALNRPVDPNHVKNIADYLIESIRTGRPYLLPPMTLNASDGVEVYVPKGQSLTSGYMILPEEHKIYITDGQHRFHAVQKVIEELRGTDQWDEFLSSGIPVMITLASSIDETHQDFADASKTKALPPSLVAVYDLRHPGNAAVLGLIERVTLFKDRVDATSATLSVNSPYVFLANQVRQFVKSSLAGRPSIASDQFYAQAQSALGNKDALQKWVDSRVNFLEVLTDIIPDWRVIAALPKPYGPEAHVVFNKMRDLRAAKTLSLSAAALTALGMVSKHVLDPMMTDGRVPDRNALKQRLAPLAKVDWSRDAAMWQTSIVSGGTVRNSTGSVRAAAEQLLALIDPPKSRLTQ